MFPFVSLAQETPPQYHKVYSFTKIKEKLYSIPSDEFYCGCPFNKGIIDFQSCNFSSNKASIRANRVEAEHVVPASAFGKSFKEYSLGDRRCVTKNGSLYSGRQCLLKISEEFRIMHNDIHNLRPAIGIVNADRSDIPYGLLDNTENRYNGCEFKWSPKVVEPRNKIKGNIARVYFYMEDTYRKRFTIDKEFLEIIKVWSNVDPVDEEECHLDRWFYSIQGNHNKFVFDHCKHAGNQ